MTGDVRLAFRHRKRIFRNPRGSNSPLAVELRSQADIRLQNTIRDSRRKHESSIAHGCKKNPKRFWGHLRSSLGSKPVISSILNVNGAFTDNDQDTGDFSTPTFALSLICLLYTSPSPRDLSTSRMPSSA